MRIPLALAMATTAHAGTIAVVAQAEESDPAGHALGSVLWHALYDQYGHDAVLLPSLDVAAESMRADRLTTLLHVSLDWKADAVHLDGDRIAGGQYPVLTTTEYVLEGGALRPRATWTTWGAVAMYEVVQSEDYVTIPEVALQEAAQLAVGPVAVPVWEASPDLVAIPVVVAADDEYRAFYGRRWNAVASARISRANGLLAQAGIRLLAVGWEDWESPDAVAELDGLLDELATHALPDRRAIRVAFTQQTHLATEFEVDFEDVGRAYLPGRHVLVADQALPPGHDPAWDEAEEGVAIAHELLHALGVPHTERGEHLMSAVKTGMVHAMTEPTRELARTAAQVRYRHWDPAAALTSLDGAAAHLDTPQRLTYIAETLALGPGMPDLHTVGPDQLSAVANVALARHYLRMARENPEAADRFRQGALTHSRVALLKQPGYVDASDVLEEAKVRK